MLIDRRTFIGVSILSTSLLFSKNMNNNKLSQSYKTISRVQLDLFPDSDDTPPANQIGATDYLFGVILPHSRIREDDKRFILNGAKWLDEESVKLYGKVYIDIDAQKRERLLKNISKTKWGDGWLREIFGYMFEAMLGDPIYGINNNEIGWKWLGFIGGFPRPQKAYL